MSKQEIINAIAVLTETLKYFSAVSDFEASDSVYKKLMELIEQL